MDFITKSLTPKWKVYVLLAAFTLLVYMPVMQGDYTFDDDLTITNNSLVHDLNHLPALFALPSNSNGGNTSYFYRPLPDLCHAFLYSIFGAGPGAQHVFSILIHVGNVCLIFMLLEALGFTVFASLLAALFFGVHPINTEAVAYISSLSDPLLLFFSLGALICYHRFHQQQKIYDAIFTLAFVFLALLTKESGVMIFLLLFVFELYLQPAKIKLSKPKQFVLFATAFLCLGYIFIRVTYIQGAVIFTNAKNEYTTSIWVRCITFFTLLPQYFGMLLFPVNQFFDKPYKVYNDLQAMGLGGLMILGALKYIFFQNIKNNKAWMLASGWFLLFLAPVSGLIATDAIYAEHWLYLPFLGLVVFVAWAAQEALLKYKQLTMTACALLLLVYSGKAAYRNYQWADAIRLYKNEIKHNKKSARVYHSLALLLHEKQDYFSAINYFALAINANDSYPQTHHHLALTYLRLNQVSNAIAEEYKALEIYPGYLLSLNTLAEIYTNLKDEKRAGNFEKFAQQAESGTLPSWNDIKENLHADK